MDPIDPAGPWLDNENIGERSNALMRENRLILDECVRMANLGTLDDPDELEEFRDLMGQSLDVEVKYLRARSAEFAEVQRRWVA